MARPPLQIVSGQGRRIETGPLQFGDDWPGVFIRGDNAFGYRMALQAVLAERADPITRSMASGLLALLASCDARDTDGNPQGGNGEADSVRSMTAGAEGIAQPHPGASS